MSPVFSFCRENTFWDTFDCRVRWKFRTGSSELDNEVGQTLQSGTWIDLSRSLNWRTVLSGHVVAIFFRRSQRAFCLSTQIFQGDNATFGRDNFMDILLYKLQLVGRKHCLQLLCLGRKRTSSHLILRKKCHQRIWQGILYYMYAFNKAVPSANYNLKTPLDICSSLVVSSQ